MSRSQISDVIKEDSWAIAEGIHEDDPLLIRFRHDFRTVSDFGGYPVLLQVTWVFEQPDEDGLPSDADTEAMERFEERILAAYEYDCHAVLTAVITSKGTRQWFFYTSDLEECGTRLAEMPQESEPYPIELNADDDPDWEFLRENVFAICEEDA